MLQAYLPDALPALRRLTAWAQERVDAGGAVFALDGAMVDAPVLARARRIIASDRNKAR